MNHLQDQHILILGLGISGLAMARWCVRCGASVTVADTRAAPPQLATLREQCPDAAFVHGSFDLALMASGPWTVVARSPGLAPEALSVVREWIDANSVPMVGELDFFAQALSKLTKRERLAYRPKVLAITGTNGKTTVTALTGLLLERCGIKVAVAGNIGPALLDVLSAELDAEVVAQAKDDALAAVRGLEETALVEQTNAIALAVAPAAATEAKVVQAVLLDESLDPSCETEPTRVTDTGPSADSEEVMLTPPEVVQLQPSHLPSVWVLELSSFQLDGTAGGAWSAVPTAAAVLNISEDHLDWHGSLDAYAKSKSAVYGDTALMLLNRNDAQTLAFTPPMVTMKVGGRNRKQASRPWVSFGLDIPTRPGDWGLEEVNGMTWLVRALAVDETRKRSREQGDEGEVYFQRLMPADALRIRGRHNAANALAALALATSTGAPLAPMLHGLREYRGEPHRVESVAIIDGVEYFDDSKGTNVGATLAAIQGLGVERRLVLILGGDGKGQDFKPLASAVAKHARAVFLIGRDATAIRACIKDAVEVAQVELIGAANLQDAVKLAAIAAQPGDAVLLSPACSSLDQFDNYQHRAQVFIDAVTHLAHEFGVNMNGAL